MERENENGQFIDKKQFIIWTALISATLLILFLTFFIIMNNKINSLQENVNVQDSPVFNDNSTSASEKDTYLIKEFDGKIGIYKNGDFQYLLDVYVFTLPENDKKLLSQGIEASSEQELNDILSSYY